MRITLALAALLFALPASVGQQQVQKLRVTWEHPDPPATIDRFILTAVRDGFPAEKLGETPSGDGTVREIVVPLPPGAFSVTITAVNRQGRAGQPSSPPTPVLGEHGAPTGVGVTVTVEVQVRTQ